MSYVKPFIWVMVLSVLVTGCGIESSVNGNGPGVTIFIAHRDELNPLFAFDEEKPIVMVDFTVDEGVLGLLEAYFE